MGSKWESGAVPVRKRGGLGAPCVCSASLVVWARHPGPSDPSLRWQRRPRPPRIRRCGGLAPRIRRCGDNSGPRSRSRHRGGNSAPALGVGTVAARGSGALGVDIVAVPGSGALGSWHSFGSGSFGLDTAVALTPLVRPLGSPALTPLVRSLGSSPSCCVPIGCLRRRCATWAAGPRRRCAACPNYNAR